MVITFNKKYYDYILRHKYDQVNGHDEIASGDSEMVLQKNGCV